MTIQPKTPARLLALIACACAFSSAQAELVQQMNLGQMTDRAERIFRGTVLRVESGTVTAGGAELPTIKYVIAVSEIVKGQTTPASGKAGNVIEINMYGWLKNIQSSADVVRFATFSPPRLERGQEYFLFTTAPSNLGLSMTVGVGQGAFKFVNGEFVVNEAKNAGLFRGMDSGGLPANGPISYSRLIERVRTEMNN